MSAGPGPGDRLGPYHLRSRAGGGASGSVFRAVDERSGESVAVKVLRVSLVEDRRALRGLAREARLAASLDHPALVRGRGLDRDGPWLFLVMDWVDGRSLAEVIQRDGPLGESRAVSILAWIASALAHTHARGIVHRDVKPGNILLGRDGHPRLTDLGLAKAPREAEVVAGSTTLGTPHYMAPEQILDPRRADPRSDLYSLGATLYHACIGEPPFRGPDLASVLAQHLHDPPVPPRDRRPGLSPAFSDLILRLLAKSPNDRVPDAVSLLHSLERWDPSGDLVRGLPPPRAGIPWFRRRGRILAAACGIVFLVAGLRVLWSPPARWAGEGFPAKGSPPATSAARATDPRGNARNERGGARGGARGAPPAGPPTPGAASPPSSPLAPSVEDARRDGDRLRLEILASLLAMEPPPSLDDCVLAFGEDFGDRLEKRWIRTFAAMGRRARWSPPVREAVEGEARRGLEDALRWFEEVERESLRDEGLPAIREAMAAKDYGAALATMTRARVRLETIATIGRERHLDLDSPEEDLARLRSLDETLRRAARADRLAVEAFLEGEARRCLEGGATPPGSPAEPAIERWLRGRVKRILGLRLEGWPRELGDLEGRIAETARRIAGGVEEDAGARDRERHAAPREGPGAGSSGARWMS